MWLALVNGPNVMKLEAWGKKCQHAYTFSLPYLRLPWEHAQVNLRMCLGWPAGEVLRLVHARDTRRRAQWSQQISLWQTDAQTCEGGQPRSAEPLPSPQLTLGSPVWAQQRPELMCEPTDLWAIRNAYCFKPLSVTVVYFIALLGPYT